MEPEGQLLSDALGRQVLATQSMKKNGRQLPTRLVMMNIRTSGTKVWNLHMHLIHSKYQLSDLYSTKPWIKCASQVFCQQALASSWKSGTKKGIQHPRPSNQGREEREN
jgi:hypothetical protein